MRVGTPDFIGERLKEAREARGMTCQSLADRLGVTRSSVSNYENGNQTPSPDVLQELSRAVDLPAQFFTRKVPPQIRAAKFFRSFHSATKRSRLMASRKYEWFREMAAFVHQFVKFPEIDVPDLGNDHEKMSLSDVQHLASELRSYWGLGDRPISNVMWLLENKGVVCCRFDFGSTSLDGFSEWRHARPFIALASDKKCCVRSRYDGAHELAHMVLHRSLPEQQLSEYSRFSLVEQQAHAFGSAFLLPESTFSSDFVTSLDGLRDLKRKWLMSIGAMVKRGRQLNLISETVEKNLWRRIGRRKWRTREPLDDVLPPEEPEFIRRSVRLLEERGLSSPKDIAFQLTLSEREVVQLCSITDRMEVKLIDEASREKTPEDSPSIIPFPK